MKQTQVKVFKDDSVLNMEMKANEFLRSIPSSEVLHIAVRDGILLILYRETIV